MEPLPPDPEPQLDFAAISTHASVLENRHRLVLRYSVAILEYATALLGDRDEAEDVHMQVVANMLEGKFTQTAAPDAIRPGGFRFYVKKAVHHAVLNHRRQRSRGRNLLQRFWNRVVPQRGSVGKDDFEEFEAPADAALEEAERRIWRETVLKRAMDAALKELQRYEEHHKDRTQRNVYHTLARLLVEHPGENSDQLALRLAEQVGGEFNAGQVRGIVLRMRKKLAEFLVAEIISQLDDPTRANVLDELSDLGLLGYVKPYLPA
jgi:hypothetical protein